MSKIYTKTGDKGYTSLYDGKRIAKTDMRFEALGDIDELNASLGISLWELIELSYKVQPKSKNFYQILDINSEIKDIQKSLFDVGASIATTTNEEKMKKVKFDENLTLKLEQLIDKWTDKLEKLRNFILPNDNLHLARAICRRAERHILHLTHVPTIIPTPELPDEQARTLPGELTGKLPGELTGKLPGELTGKLLGELTGKLPGELTGKLPGELTGKLPGELTGKLPGELTGKLTGKLPGELTGKLSGELTGKLPDEQAGVDMNILIYMNRLSDYLFTIARVKTELVEQRDSCIWKK